MRTCSQLWHLMTTPQSSMLPQYSLKLVKETPQSSQTSQLFCNRDPRDSTDSHIKEARAWDILTAPIMFQSLTFWITARWPVLLSPTQLHYHLGTQLNTVKPKGQGGDQCPPV